LFAKKAFMDPKQITIGFDLDSTLVQSSVMRKVSLEFNIDLPEQSDWGFSEFSPEVRKRVFELFRDPSFMCGEVTPIWGAKTFLKDLKHLGFNLKMITARANEVKAGTIELVNKHFPQIESIHFVEPHETKKDLMIQNKLNFWVDDAPHEIQNAISLGISTLMISNDKTLYNWKMRTNPALLGVFASVRDIDPVLFL